MADRLVALGRFGAPHGVRGELRVKAYTADPEAVGGCGPLTDARGLARYALRVVRFLRDDMVIARVEGVATREAAAALTEVEFFARRSQLPAPDAEEFYYNDLIGLAAVSPEGAALGVVTAVHNHGAGDILEIEGDGAEPRLLPFTRQVAPEIDFAARRIVIVPPLEIEAREEE